MIAVPGVVSKAAKGQDDGTPRNGSSSKVKTGNHLLAGPRKFACLGNGDAIALSGE